MEQFVHYEEPSKPKKKKNKKGSNKKEKESTFETEELWSTLEIIVWELIEI